MTCIDYESALVDRARGERHDLSRDGDLDAHIQACGHCAVRLEHERRLTAALRALRDRTAGPADPAALEASLVAAFEGQRTGEPRAAAPASWRGRFALAAMLVLAIAGATLARRAADLPTGSGIAAPQQAGAGGPQDSEFVPWPGAASLPPFESGQLVRTELPASVLPLLGIRPARAAVGNRVVADVLVGQDGLARAVRLAN
jgi:hypothetical protein